MYYFRCNFHLAVDFIYNEDKTRVVANEYKLTFLMKEGTQEEANNIRLYSDSAVTVTVEDTTFVIHEPCNLSPEEALQELVATVVDLFVPEMLWHNFILNY